ncbi:hypothetical protein DV736_g5815, partial [Chaetothyriales sp. CBS 134916]
MILDSMTTSTRHGLSLGTIESAAGLTAGLVSTIIVHPLDIIKTRLQVDSSAHPLLNSSRSVFRDLLRNKGPSRIAALYRGLTPNLVGNSAGWALYFLFYKHAQDLIRHWRHYSPSQRLTGTDYLAASAASGLLSALLTNPIWVVKTRMLTTSASQSGAYPGLIPGLYSIGCTEGVKGYFHGLTPSMFGVAHGALYFLAYEKLKQWRRQQKQTSKLSNSDTILTSSLSKVFAGVLTYPHQVVRARMQTHVTGAAIPKDKAFISVVRSLWWNEGLIGFYKGMFPNLLRVVPSTCVTFLVYENVRLVLPRIFGSSDPAITKSSNVQPKGPIWTSPSERDM